MPPGNVDLPGAETTDFFLRSRIKERGYVKPAVGEELLYSFD